MSLGNAHGGHALRDLVSLGTAIEASNAALSVTTERLLVRTEDALDAVLAEDMKALKNIPPKPRAEMDGYAVRSSDVQGSSPSDPTSLKLVLSPETARKRTCVRVNTGEYVPSAYDAVCMIEKTSAGGEEVAFMESLHPGENISPVGCDMKAGETLIRKGSLLTEFDLAALAMNDIRNVRIQRHPSIGILNTGNELIPFGGEETPNSRINSNEIMLVSLLKRAGLSPLQLGIVSDDISEVAESISQSMRRVDSLLITGGTAVGEGDVVAEAVESVGGTIVTHGIAMRPGRPTGMAVVGGKPVFMLSGNPVACAIGFLFFAYPVLKHAFGLRGEPFESVSGKLSRRISCPPSFRCVFRVTLHQEGGEWGVRPVAVRGAGVISTLVKADGFLEVPEGIEGFEEGDEVNIKLYRPLAGMNLA